MSRFRKLSHAIWYCQYHMVWVPKYRYRVLTAPVGKELWLFRLFSGFRGHIQSAAVEVDGVDEVLLVPKASRGVLHPLNPGIQ